MAKKRSTESQSEHQLALASAVAHRVQIMDIRLMSSSATVKEPFSPKGEEVEIGFSTEATIDGTHSLLEVVVVTSVSSRDELGLRIDAAFALRYKLKAEGNKLSKKHFSAFAELNGLFNVWPYWREFVQSMTTRMGLPSLTLPVRQPVKRVAIARQAADTRSSGRQASSRKK